MIKISSLQEQIPLLRTDQKKSLFSKWTGNDKQDKHFFVCGRTFNCRPHWVVYQSAAASGYHSAGYRAEPTDMHQWFSVTCKKCLRQSDREELLNLFECHDAMCVPHGR